MQHEKMLERTIDVITKILDRVDDIYKAVPKDSDHTGIHTLAVKSFDKLSKQLNSIGETTGVNIVAVDDPKSNDIMYIAVIDVDEGEEDTACVTILKHDFITYETSTFTFEGISNEDSSEILSRLIKDLPIEHTVALLAHFDTITGSEVTEITKTVVEAAGISAILTAFSRSDTEYQGTALELIGNKDPNMSEDKLHSFITENIMKFVKIFQTVIMMDGITDEDAYLLQNDINPDNAKILDTPDKKMYINGNEYISNTRMVDYEMKNSDTKVTVFKIYLSK